MFAYKYGGTCIICKRPRYSKGEVGEGFCLVDSLKRKKEKKLEGGGENGKMGRGEGENEKIH